MAKIVSEKIKFLKVRKVKSPSRAYEFDAGIDFYVPEFTKQFIEDLKKKNPLVFELELSSTQPKLIYNDFSSITLSGPSSKVEYNLNDINNTVIKFDEETGENYFLLPPHSRIMIPSGIKLRMATPGRALIAGNKSGIATKHGLVFGAEIADYTYKGEIHLSLINTSTKNVRIYENMKIIQFIETPIFNSIVEVEESFYVYPGPNNKSDEPISPAEEKFYEGLQNDRGTGGFGSSDKRTTKIQE